MRTIHTALLWELFNRQRWQLLLMLCVASLLPMLLYTALSWSVPPPLIDPATGQVALQFDGAINPAEPAFVIMHVVLVQINMFIFGAGLMTSMGPMSRLYAYPARTSTLVGAQLIPAVSCMIVQMILSTAILNAMFEVRWPILGPALFSGAALTGVIAVAWMAEKSGWLPLSVAVVGAGFGMWFASRHGPLFAVPTHYWNHFTLEDSLTLLLFTGLSYAVAVQAVARNRHGEPPLSLGILAWLQRVLDQPTAQPELLRSPTESQLWFEWRKKGWGMPAGVLFGLLTGLAGWVLFSRDLKLLVEGLLQGGSVLMGLVGLVGGLMLGNCGSSDQDLAMSQFLATRPMTNAQLARMMLWNTAKSAVSALGIWVAMLAVIVVPLLVSGTVDFHSLDTEVQSHWWWLPLAAMSPWLIGAGMAVIALTGRTQPFLGIILTAFAVGIATNFVVDRTLTDEQQRLFWQIAFASLGVITALITAWLFIVARRRELVDPLTAWMSLTVWLVLLAIVVALQIVQPEFPWLVAVFVAGMLSLVVMPLAGTPLALAWNRTR